ncbi:unnamed protein product [Moneuplotes crassus]|uniref:Uncharacterized protein n=1 Tax=Euplotes crassus TaxID=5936 RepID=A0AAD1YAZ0_EUPCR|nr:unnamed protein product [Moneuplotes crassus]
MDMEEIKNNFQKLRDSSKEDELKDFGKAQEIEVAEMPSQNRDFQERNSNTDDDSQGFQYPERKHVGSKIWEIIEKYKSPIIAGLLCLVMNVMYMISNTSLNCDFEYHFNDCVVALRKAFPAWLGECALAGVIWGVTMILSLTKVFHRAWAIFLLVNLIILFFYKNGMTANYHGSLNRVIFIFIILVTFGVYGVYRLFKFIHSKNTKIFWTCVIVTLFLWLTFYFTKIEGSCNGWEKGLGARSILNTDGYCPVPIPTKCELSIRDGALAIYKLGNTCDKRPNKFQFSKLPPSLQSNEKEYKKIGYPRVEDYATEVHINQNLFREHVFENYFYMEDPNVSEEVKNNTEFYIDMTNPDEHKIVMEVKPNATRAQEQKELYQTSRKQEEEMGTFKDRIDKNMLILYIDNLSRAHFYRKMPKTAAWLDQYVDNEENEYSAYQFFRYHGVYFNTQFSNSALWFGAVHEVENTSTNIFDSFQRHGYITGFFKDSCETRASEIRNEDLKTHRFDHFGGTISCDDNFDRKQVGQVTWFEGKGSSLRHCIYGQNIHNVQIEYLKQFWEAYPENRKLFRTHFSEAHEGMGELINVIDEDFRDLLEYFMNKGYLEDTYITILSDHGAHGMTLKVPGIPDNSRDIENYYPLLFKFTKNDIPKTTSHYLLENEQSFISSHDIYETMNSIAENKRTNLSEAKSYVFTQEQVPKTSDCSNSTVYTDKCFCKN